MSRWEAIKSLLIALLFFIIICKCSCISPSFYLVHSQLLIFPQRCGQNMLFCICCQTGSELKPNKSCVLQPAVVNCQILTGETDVTKRKPKFKLWQFQKLHAFRQNLKMPKYWFMQHSSQCPWFLKNVQSFSQSRQTLLRSHKHLPDMCYSGYPRVYKTGGKNPVITSKYATFQLHGILSVFVLWQTMNTRCFARSRSKVCCK